MTKEKMPILFFRCVIPCHAKSFFKGHSVISCHNNTKKEIRSPPITSTEVVGKGGRGDLRSLNLL